ncbi:M23 family metallopeptidase [Agromyces badenianii]|uniref:M23 family metallopeptidase n=1 Tax=Agromyces badenianii TaxID=2080742 RepID=UPI000D58CF7D|nr:M23 family metallopeptidase [Agromyces badenianii]PWC05314.1 hypothetical protein DCE94_03240 [Agromyces badenianii]
MRARIDPELLALLGARSAIDRAASELREAEAELESAQATEELAHSIAEQLEVDAAEARDEADAAARIALAAAQGDGAAMGSMDAVFGAGNDLLAGLGAVARVTQIAGDADELLTIAAKRAAAAERAEDRAAEAEAEAGTIDISAVADQVASATRVLQTATNESSDLKTRVAASSIAVVESLPHDAGQLSSQGWAEPVAGRITDGYGPRPDKPVAGVNEFHRGTDLAAACGTPVYAATAGVVAEAGPNGSYGNWVLIGHGADVSTGYAHLADGGVLVAPGQAVSAGELIGTVGSTGASTGCHLHLEVRLGGVAVDAVPFLAARGVAFD